MVGISKAAARNVALTIIFGGCGDTSSNGASPNDGSGEVGEGSSGHAPGSTDEGTGATTGDDTGPGSASSGSGTTGGDTDAPAAWQAVLELSSRVVVEADDDGSLAARCTALHDGVPYDGEIEALLAITPLRGVTQAGAIEFAEFGVYELSCEVTVDGQVLATSADVSVLDEAIDPALARLGIGLGQLEAGLLAVLDADGEDDSVLVDAHATLVAAAPTLTPEAYVALDDVLRMVPGDWPTTAALDGLGIAANADDTALPAAITAFDGALADLEETLAAIDPAALQDADVEALHARSDALQAAVDQLEALEPTAHGLLATRAQATTVVRDRLRSAAASLVAYNDALIRAEADRLFAVAPPDDLAAAPRPQHFGFLGLAIGSFGQSYLQIQLVNKWYGKYIKELDKSINNLILIGAIDYYLPADPNGPVIDYLIASASLGFAQPGYPTWIDGYNFHEDPQMNVFIVVGEQWQGILENVFSACGVEEADTVPEKIETVLKCLEDIEGAVESLFHYPLSVGPGQYGSPQGLDFGEFPQACSGPLPIAIGLIPINLAVGRGPSYAINCLDGGG